jgi:hypothetical protein
VDYKKRLLKARNAYYSKVQNATADDHIKAQAEKGSVAEAEADEFVKLDFSLSYNLGDKPEDMNPVDEKNYREFIKAFDLPEPTGKPPKKKFYLTDY